MIRCFFDDSGKESDPSNRFVCMAGYLALGDSYWNIFAQGWNHLLLKHGITWVHMKEMIPLQGEYSGLGWDTTKRDAVLKEFISVIKFSQLIGFGVGLDAEAWRTLVPKDVTKREGDAQVFCLTRILRMIVERMKKSVPRDYAALHFDSDESFVPARFRRFRKVIDRVPDGPQYLGSITFTDPKLYAPLQSADLLAWETRKELMQKTGGFESTDRFKELFRMLPLGDFPDYTSELWTAEELLKQYPALTA